MASATKVQLTGGNFQDSEGNLLSGGYLTFRLNQDEHVADSQICAGISVRVNLDGYGAIISGQYVWGNDQLLPINSYYKVTGYTAKGQIAWGPNNQQVIGNGGTFDVGTWIPNQVISWFPSVQTGTSVALEVNGTLTADQTLLNLIDSATVTFANVSGGVVQATAVVPTPPAANCLPQPDAARFALWEASPTSPVLYTVNDINVTNRETGGPVHTPVAASATAGVSLHVASTFPSSVSDYDGGLFIYPGRKTTIKGTLFAGSAGALTTLFAGASTQVQPYGANVLTAGYGIYLAMSGTTSAMGTWKLICANDAPGGASPGAGSFTTVDTLVPVVESTRYSFKLVMDAGVVTAFIDGVQVATCSTNLPTVPLFLRWVWLGDSGASADFEYLYGENVTP